MIFPIKAKKKKRKAVTTATIIQILAVDTIKLTETNEQVRKEHLRTRKHQENDLCSWYLIKIVNILTVSFVRYSWPFFIIDKRRTQTDRPQNKETDDDVPEDSIKEGRGFANVEDCVYTTIHSRKEYPKRAKKYWLQQPVTEISTEITKRSTRKQQ